MDKIFIKGLRADALIGAYTHERIKKQPIILDLELAVDTRQAAASDNLADALNYDTLATRVKQVISQSQFYLIETLAEHIAQFIMREFNVKKIRLKIRKPNVLADVDHVGIEIKRER